MAKPTRLKKESGEYFINFREDKKLTFGDAFHACKCPNETCGLLLEWKYVDDGIWQSYCCGKVYEMYAEVVTLKCTGVTGLSNPVLVHRRKEAKIHTGNREAVVAEQITELDPDEGKDDEE